MELAIQENKEIQAILVKKVMMVHKAKKEIKVQKVLMVYKVIKASLV